MKNNDCDLIFEAYKNIINEESIDDEDLKIERYKELASIFLEEHGKDVDFDEDNMEYIYINGQSKLIFPEVKFMYDVEVEMDTSDHMYLSDRLKRRTYNFINRLDDPVAKKLLKIEDIDIGERDEGSDDAFVGCTITLEEIEIEEKDIEHYLQLLGKLNEFFKSNFHNKVKELF